MKIVSWNVNGIRACANKGFKEVLENTKADFFCVQESKACLDQVDITQLHSPNEFQSTWASAEKKGYSGCTIFTPHMNVKLTSNLDLPDYDREGRGNIAFAKDFTLVNLYFPNGAASPERHQFKMTFLDTILSYLKKLEKKHGPLIICGDYNIAHTEIDIHDPKGNKDSSGFLPEERAWMTTFFENGFVDTFRHLHPNERDAYSWWSFRQASRARNKGWRLDYISISESLLPALKTAQIHPDIMGSDHCPVSIELKI